MSCKEDWRLEMASQMREREKPEDYKEHYLEPKAREGCLSDLRHALKYHSLLGSPPDL